MVYSFNDAAAPERHDLQYFELFGLREGREAKFAYNVLGIQEFVVGADEPIPAGTHQVRMEFAYDGGGLAKGGDVTLYYDGTSVLAAGELGGVIDRPGSTP